MPELSSTYWFVLGHEPLLSLAELHQVFPGTHFSLVSPSIAKAELTLDPALIIKQLGGIIKIAEEIGSPQSEEALLSAITTELATVEGKIHFGLSILPGKGALPSTRDLAIMGLKIKKIMKGKDRSVRYVDNRGTLTLSSASVINNGLINRGREFLIIPQGGNFSLAKTLSVQPFEAFSDRDFGRPGRDDVSGMLPPKLAIMMINCASANKNELLYDPSCGSGTIVSEALLLGYTQVAGSDISEKAIDDSKKNTTWLEQIMRVKLPEPTLFVHDIRNTPKALPPHSVGAIVSEPFMGPPLKGRETPDQLQRNAAELAELYNATFATFAQVLKPGGTVVYSFPRFGNVRTSPLVLENLAKLGFIAVPLLPGVIASTAKQPINEPYVLYQRAGQHVGREIWKFIYKT